MVKIISIFSKMVETVDHFAITIVKMVTILLETPTILLKMVTILLSK